MNSYKTILVEIKGAIAHIGLNRPEVHNALDSTMISELLDILKILDEDNKVRILVISGKGKSFCAGADIKWMYHTQQLTYQENLMESLHLAEFFYALYNHRKITIAAVKGAAYGGGIGLICACDLAFSLKTIPLAFSEIKIGIIPATITPYVISKIGRNKTLELMLGGNRFDGATAERIGLVNSAIDESEFDKFLGYYMEELLKNAPQSQLEIKNLVNYLVPRKIDSSLVRESAELIANARITSEAKEGIKAFIEKRQPNWQ